MLVLTFIPSHRPTEGLGAEKPKGERLIMEIIERKGYRAGNVYSCAMFVQDIAEQLQCGVKVTFGPHPNGKRSAILRLEEIRVLSDNDAEEMVQAMVQGKNSVFTFENLPAWEVIG